MGKPLLKISFTKPQTLQERVDNGYGEPFKCMHVVTNMVKELTALNCKVIYVLGGYFGFIDPASIKSIEFIQPNQL